MRLLRVEQVVHQLHVAQFADDGNALVGEHVHLVLDVEAELGNGRILQDGLELGCGGFGGDAAVLGLGGDRHLGHRGEDARAGRIHDEGAAARRAHGGRDLHGGRFFHFQLGGLVGGIGRRMLVDVGDETLEGVEFVFFEEVGQDGTVVQVEGHVVQLHVQGDVRLDGDELLAEVDIGARSDEHVTLLLRQGIDVGIDVLESPVLGDQLAGPDFADTLDAGDVVGGVATDGQHVDHLLRAVDAVAGADLGDADDLVVTAGAARLVLPDMVGDQLSVVLVGSNHVDVHPLRGGPDGHRADHVVRLEARLHQDGDVHRPDDLGQGLQGVDDQLGRIRAVGLVGGIHFVAEGASRRVEGHGEMGGFLALDELEQILGESEQDRSVRPLGVDHRAPQKGVVHLEYEGVSVYEKQSSWHNLQIYEKDC